MASGAWSFARPAPAGREKWLSSAATSPACISPVAAAPRASKTSPRRPASSSRTSPRAPDPPPDAHSIRGRSCSQDLVRCCSSLFLWQHSTITIISRHPLNLNTETGEFNIYFPSRSAGSRNVQSPPSNFVQSHLSANCGCSASKPAQSNPSIAFHLSHRSIGAAIQASVPSDSRASSPTCRTCRRTAAVRQAGRPSFRLSVS